ncbi:energy transducer TonB [Acidobacterium sp. S8]|uniref:energy transducer TonB n=1 Tax=Acidobacterium sp. S8 TaxID=1641854 RepID=UPI00131BD219|nr:energy transducer TonB [Acidobacterium sp. S8]
MIYLDSADMFLGGLHNRDAFQSLFDCSSARSSSQTWHPTAHGILLPILSMPSMIKVTALLIALCGLVPCAKAIKPNDFSTSNVQQQDVGQSSQQGNATNAGMGQLRICDSNAPINCHAVDGVTAPKVVYAPDPKFTRTARKKKLSGKSVVSLVVGSDGKPYDVRLIRSMSEGLDPSLQPAALELDQKAIEAVQKYKFQPATYQNKPVPVEVHVEVNFLIY